MTRTITDPAELRAFIMSRYESDKDDLGHACMKAVINVLALHEPDVVTNACYECDIQLFDGELCNTVNEIVKACAVSFG